MTDAAEVKTEIAVAKKGIAGAIIDSLRGPWSIALYTYREGMRKKILIGFLILSLLVIFGSSFISSFLPETTVGEVKTDMNLRFIKDLCLASISVFGILITIFISALVVPAECENRVIYTILSKPINRLQYLLGKFIGVQLIVLINLGLMGFLFAATLYIKQPEYPNLLLWSIILTYFEFLIVSAFTFAVSCASSSPLLPTIAGLFIYLTGQLTEYLKDVAIRAEKTGEASEAIVSVIAKGLYYILPNLQNFSLRMQIINNPPNDPVRDVMIPALIEYGLIYALCGFVMAYWIFRRKEL